MKSFKQYQEQLTQSYDSGSIEASIREMHRLLEHIKGYTNKEDEDIEYHLEDIEDYFFELEHNMQNLKRKMYANLRNTNQSKETKFYRPLSPLTRHPRSA